MKPENRDIRYMIRMKPSEHNYLRREADERGQRLSEYIRAVLFANAVFNFSDGGK
jgi:hypothetical protein